jgi:dsRNA-specific ribonuclease
MNNTSIQDQSISISLYNSNFLGRSDLNNSSILERTFLKENPKQEEKMVTRVNLDILKSLKIEDILRSLTSKIYKHQKSENYEEYEFIGDVVLKFLATVQIFIEKVSA